MAMRDTPGPIPTLEDLPLHDVTHINVWCGRWPYPCAHHGRIAVKNINLKQTILQFASKLVCEKCGTKGGHAMPSWPIGGGGPGAAHNHGGSATNEPPQKAR